VAKGLHSPGGVSCRRGVDASVPDCVQPPIHHDPDPFAIFDTDQPSGLGASS
jgi:hypothetical protein